DAAGCAQHGDHGAAHDAALRALHLGRGLRRKAAGRGRRRARCGFDLGRGLWTVAERQPIPSRLKRHSTFPITSWPRRRPYAQVTTPSWWRVVGPGLRRDDGGGWEPYSSTSSREGQHVFDIKWIRENAEAFDQGLKNRGIEPQSAKLIELDEARRRHLGKLQD